MKRFVVLLIVLFACCLYAGQVPKEADIVRVQVVFTQDTECGQYRDALYFTPAEYAALKPADLAAKKQARVDTWVDRIKNPPPPVEPTTEQLEAEVVEVQRQKTALDARLVELASLIAAKVKAVGEVKEIVKCDDA